MISAVTNQGKVRFRLFESSMNAELLIDFMQRLIKDAQRKGHPDSRELAHTPRQGGQGMAGGTWRRNRSVLSAGLFTRTEPG